MALATKPFRIEQILGDALIQQPQAANASMSNAQHGEIMAELTALRRMMEPAQELNSSLVENYRSELNEALKLKKEMGRNL